MQSAGYTCPYCDKLKAQDNPQNAMQNIRSKHRNRPEISINELHEAAPSTNVSEKNGEDEEKDAPSLDTVEVEDNTNSAVHKESILGRCERSFST